MAKAKRKQKSKKDWSNLSSGVDALWDTFSQIARSVAGIYLVYTYLFVSVEHLRDAWMLAVGAALVVDFALEIYRINHDARKGDDGDK